MASGETVLHIPSLRSLHARIVESGAMALEPAEWVETNTLLCGLGLGLKETLDYLYFERPGYPNFEQWVIEKNGGSIEPERIARINASIAGDAPLATQPIDPVLTADDLAFWAANGYIVLHDAVPREGAAAAAAAIYEHLGADPTVPDTWYRGPQGHSIWVNLIHHPAVWENRRSRRIHAAFAQIWGTRDLWMTADQCGFNPPERPGWQFPGPYLHWDVSIEPPIPFGVQGILYLTDTAAEQGAFQCVPGFHRQIDGWLSGLPAGADPRRQDLAALGPIPIAGKAGDLIVWHQALPHGASPNRAAHPRVVQYLKMQPSRWDYQATWK